MIVETGPRGCILKQPCSPPFQFRRKDPPSLLFDPREDSGLEGGTSRKKYRP